jgi:hypothetical protein
MIRRGGDERRVDLPGRCSGNEWSESGRHPDLVTVLNDLLGRSAHSVQEHAEAGVAAPPLAERVVSHPARISAVVPGLFKAG